MQKNSFIILIILFSLTTLCLGLAQSTGPDGSNVKALHDLGLTGQGINIGLISSGNALDTHEAFQRGGTSIITNNDFSGSGISVGWHDTWVSGILASQGGAAHPNDIGVAPGSNIYSARVGNLVQALEWMRTNYCKIVVSGIQYQYDPTNPSDPAWPDGNSNATVKYDYYAYQHNIIFANASGNHFTDPCSGQDVQTVTSFGDAYNGITTGGLRPVEPDVYRRVGTISNIGPTLDGRKKPDVVAPSNEQTVPTYTGDTAWTSTPLNGDGATSFAAPHTAGIAAILLQYANSTDNVDDAQDEVIRAVIVNSTEPNIKDDPNNFTDPLNNVWHAHRGYGRVDALAAYQTLSAGEVSKSPTVINQQKGWAYDYSSGYSTHIYDITAAAGQRLVLTVTWDRYVEKIGINYITENPLLNIDMTVLNPDATTLYSETDGKNNLIKIDLLLTQSGVYSVKLLNKANSNKSNNRYYALAFELLDPLPCDLEQDYKIDEKDLMRMTEFWLNSGEAIPADFDINGIVDMNDIVILNAHWIDFDPRYINY